MAMAVDHRHPSQLSSMGYNQYQQPHFTNPWSQTSNPGSQQMYASSVPPHHSTGLESHSLSQPQAIQRPTSIAIPFQGIPVTAAPVGSDLISRSYGTYPTSSSTTNTYAPTSAPYSQMDYPTRDTYAFQQDTGRRSSHPLVPSPPLYDDALESQRQRQSSLVDFSRMNMHQPQRGSFSSDALDASRGMVSLSQSDITPRNIWGGGSTRGSTDSYGFPTAHSAHSSISSGSYGYPSSYSGEGSATDYSSATESVDLNHRTLPRPSALIQVGVSNHPPAPQSMMGQFSSKVSSSSQKKHKCKICDKRFTRPSSLQTHMYSHTGEKPFACEVKDCGRHFSVVSNLRRHRKVHKNDGLKDHGSADDSKSESNY